MLPRGAWKPAQAAEDLEGREVGVLHGVIAGECLHGVGGVETEAAEGLLEHTRDVALLSWRSSDEEIAVASL